MSWIWSAAAILRPRTYSGATGDVKAFGRGPRRCAPRPIRWALPRAMQPSSEGNRPRRARAASGGRVGADLVTPALDGVRDQVLGRAVPLPGTRERRRGARRLVLRGQIVEADVHRHRD